MAQNISKNRGRRASPSLNRTAPGPVSRIVSLATDARVAPPCRMKSVRFTYLFAALVAVSGALLAATAEKSSGSSGPAASTPSRVVPKADAAELAALRAKAERGNAIAQYNLGLAYVDGRQTAADPIEAFVWLTLAAEGGSTGKALETVLNNLSPTELAEGRRRLEAMRARNSYLRPTPRPASPTPAKPSGTLLSPVEPPSVAAAPPASAEPEPNRSPLPPEPEPGRSPKPAAVPD